MRLVVLVLPFVLGLPARAQEASLPEGHSAHGQVFNEGPRQRAELLPGTGSVDFPITTKSALAQKFFHQGVGQLHGYWYFEAERSFRQVAAIDRDCAMAYWGMAMANVDNPDRAVAFAWEAYKRRAKAGARERMYIEAYARYWDATEEPPKAVRKAVRSGRRTGRRRPQRAKQDALYTDFEEILLAYPQDIEARAFLVNQIYLDRDRNIPVAMKNDNQALLDVVFAANPMHPAHHYRIHLWDRDQTAARTLDSAWKCGHAAPAIAHMWHMGGHTYAKLGRHADAAWAQEASARVDHAHMIRRGVMPYEIHNYTHNNEWLCRSLRHVGRIKDAVDVAKNMIELPRHPKWRSRSGSLGRRRLLETLAMAELWEEIAALEGTAYLEHANPGFAAENAFTLGRAHAMTGRLSAARAQLATLAATPPPTGERGRQGSPSSQARQRRDQRRAQLAALIAFAEGDRDTAIAELERCGYAREHLAVLCLQAGRKEKAMELLPRRSRPGIAPRLAIRSWVQWRAGHEQAAERSFRELRALSARFDLDVPIFRRLVEIAQALDLPRDWRVSVTTPPDVGPRPTLASLGPLRWSPAKAPDWKLRQGPSGELSLADYSGKPILLVLFLGFGCVHCVEQLEALKPRAGDFADAGIEIVTIGTDTLEQVKASIQQGIEADEEPIPFPVLCDPDGVVFRQYRCWDDFENMALHGTFLIDANGLVRWQDISFEPFKETDFLLQECKRLLRLPARGARSLRR